MICLEPGVYFFTRGPGSPWRPPFLRRRNFANILPMFPLLNSVTCVPPPYELAPIMRILMPKPIGSGDHPGPLIIHLHPTRWIDYSASFSGNFRGSFWRCVRLFGGHFGGVLVGFWRKNARKTIRKTGKIYKNLIFYYLNIALNSLFNE